MKTRSMLGLAVASGCAWLLVAAAPVAAQSGSDLFTSKGCIACHGAEGKKSLLPTYPRLAGQNAPYVMYALKAYKAQQRQGEQAPLMAGMAAQLNDAEIEKIADFLSKVE
jgi:cytochrome c553